MLQPDALESNRFIVAALALSHGTWRQRKHPKWCRRVARSDPLRNNWFAHSSFVSLGEHISFPSLTFVPMHIHCLSESRPSRAGAGVARAANRWTRTAAHIALRPFNRITKAAPRKLSASSARCPLPACNWRQRTANVIDYGRISNQHFIELFTFDDRRNDDLMSRAASFSRSDIDVDRTNKTRRVTATERKSMTRPNERNEDIMQKTTMQA